MINGFMDQAELKGLRESAKYYEALIKNTQSQKTELEKERAALLSSLQGSLDKGDFSVGDVEFIEAMNDINAITESIQEADTNILTFANDIRQISWDTFDVGQERISQLIDEADFLVKLMSNDDLFDDRGNTTDQGDATMGLYAQNYNTYMSQADKYASEIEKINNDLANDPYNQDLIERKQELIEKQRESILAAEDEKQAMKDLAEQGYNAQLESLQDLIDKYKEVQESQKKLADYQKEVSDQSTEISRLQKMTDVYSKINTEEGRMKYQEYQNQLKDAQEQLEETQYDKYISDQEELLDQVYSQAEEFFNEKLSDTDGLISELIATTNEKSSEIADTLREESEAVGYDLSTEMESIWGSNGTATSVLSTYSQNFTSIMTALQGTIDKILEAVDKETAVADEQAETDVTTATTVNTSNPAVTGVTPTTSNSNSSSSTENKSTTSKDDEILKIINSGKSGASYIAQQRKAKNHSKLWTYIVDKYGHVPTYAIYKKLGNKLGVKAPKGYKVSSETNALLSALKAKGYASGTKKADEDYAWTHEGELIRRSDGGIWTNINKGTVFSKEATDNLWDVGNHPENYKNAPGASDLANVQYLKSGNSDNTNLTIENEFILPNVKNYSEFLTEMQHDKKFENMIVDMTIGRINGGSKLAKLKYQW